MKYICLGYIEPGKLPEMTEEQMVKQSEQRRRKRTAD
jgi:hypothetical protein